MKVNLIGNYPCLLLEKINFPFTHFSPSDDNITMAFQVALIISVSSAMIIMLIAFIYNEIRMKWLGVFVTSFTAMLCIAVFWFHFSWNRKRKPHNIVSGSENCSYPTLVNTKVIVIFLTSLYSTLYFRL
jgi:hypothetical protein